MKKIYDRLTLRVRLTFLYAGLLAVILSILGITFFVDTRSLLINYVASHLRARAKPVIEHWLYPEAAVPSGSSHALRQPDSEHLKQIADPIARDLTSRNTVALVLDRKGNPIAKGRRLPEEPVPPPPEHSYYSQALAGKNEVTYIVPQNGHRTLVILIPLRQRPAGSSILGVVQLSSPLTPVENTLFHHGVSLAIGTAITLIIGSCLGFLLISSALAGLNRMVHTCREISEGDLSQRVNLPRHEDEIGTLAKAFDEMVDRIESTIDAQRRFIANAAHEIRTPLTALRGSLEVLLRGSQDDPASFSRLSQGMYRDVMRLTRLCEQLLDLARLEISGKIHKEPLMLDEFFKRFSQQARTLAREHEVVIREGPLVRVPADPDILEQILLNLIHNAIQHSEKARTITLGWALIPDQVEIRVADEGEGIRPEDIGHIFEPFFRGGGSASGGGKGTGLGLAIVKAMVEAHNGQISVESQRGKGTVFRIYLPLQ
ncbi:MAG: HAMP domain-containing histidine kinase [Deltaproteobacteria bacterium]|nr:MAG: HAMP domain-containing histidine kinase [Deltaproteobacteria bacterium]